ncbi:MAG: hypothetical protein GXX86_07060 [Propionibacterium sp.]|nr:hypothetical protein [Propionibacterium sp.]
MKRHVLKPPVPVRALVIAAIATVLGALIIVLTAALPWPGVVFALGAMAVLFGLIVLGYALLAPARKQLVISTDENGYQIEGNQQQTARGSWSDVIRATQSDTGARITLELRDGHEEHIMAPGTAHRTVMDRVAADIEARLADRR